MKFLTLLLLLALIAGILATHFTVRASRGNAERFFAIRSAAFAWIVGFLLLAAFIFLPNKQRVLMLLPAFVIAVSVAKFVQNGRARLRRERQARVDLDRMKRVN